MSGLDTARTRRAANRVLLAVTGAFAVASGTWVAAVGLAERGTSVPFPLPDLHGAVDAASRALGPWRDRAWWAPAAVFAALAVALCLLLWWLAAQAGARSPRTLPLPGDRLAIRTRALARAVAAEAETLPGVTRARVHLSPRRRGLLRARLVLTLAPHAEPERVLHALTHGTVPSLRTGSGATRLDCAVRLRLAAHRTRRTR